VLLDENGSTVMFGSSRDAEDARRLRGTRGGPLLYVRAGSEVYLVRDPATIDRVRAEMRAHRELVMRRTELGGLQAEMGRQQVALGLHQAEMSAAHAKEAANRMAGMGPVHEQIAALTGALAALRINETDASAEIANARRALTEAIAALERSAKSKEAATATEARTRVAETNARLRQELEARQQTLGEEMRALAERQAQMGREQTELGKAQRAAAEAVRARVKAILDEARAQGLTEGVK
jgi:hypothetical protein